MYNWLLPVFSTVCGENPEHLWLPGGQRLPCCQRCTGLYVGALIAMALHQRFRPPINKRFLQLHSVCLLQLGLFAFPWLPQSAVIRTISGSLFGFGVVAFLWPAITAWCPTFRVSRFSTAAYEPVEESARWGRRAYKFSDFRGSLAGRVPSRGAVWSFSTACYTFGLFAGLALTPTIAVWGGTSGAIILTCLLSAGALALAALASVNVVRCLRAFALRDHMECGGKRSATPLLPARL